MSKQKNADIFKKSLGEKIKSLREKNNETQAKLARKIGVEQNSISKAECGKNCLSIPNLIKLCEHYNVTLDYLCRDIKSTTVIDNLDKVISIKYSNISFEENYSYPQIEIEKEYFKYLFQTAKVIQIKDIPEEIKNNWLNQIKNRFLKHNYSNQSDNKSSSTERESFAIVPKELLLSLNNHNDVLRDIQKYFYELNL